jgi:hypothetical protein
MVIVDVFILAGAILCLWITLYAFVRAAIGGERRD